MGKRPIARNKSATSNNPEDGFELLPGEAFGVDDRKISNKTSDEDLNIRYARGDIRIVTESARYSLAGILSMLEEEMPIEGSTTFGTERRYKLDPEYQRRHRWSNERKSRLIESFLMNIPVPPVFLYERDLARFEVMDGRQRLTALAEFYDNKFHLEGLEYWPELNGRYYKTLPTKVRDGIDRRYISSIILLKETATTEEQAAFLKKIVFERLNSGGVKLSSQETRNAVYGGPLNQLCLRLSGNEAFQKMWRIPVHIQEVTSSDEDTDNNSEFDVEGGNINKIGERMFEKMEDVELVLRFFAFRHIHRSKTGLNKITEFLDDFLRAGNGYNLALLTEYERLFENTISFLWECLGDNAFAVLTDSKPRPTKVVYDTIMFVANFPQVIAMRSKIIENKTFLIDALRQMYEADRNKQHPTFAGRRTNNSDITVRVNLMRDAFFGVLEQIRSAG